MKRICSECGAEFEGVSRDIRCPVCRKHQVHPEKERTCQSCGRTYFSRGSRSRFCPECAAERARKNDRQCRERKKAGNTRLIGSTDICAECGNEYIVASGMQRYCPECAEARKKRIHREVALKKYYSGGKERRDERTNARVMAEGKCIVCGKTYPLADTRLLCCSAECSEVHAYNLKRKWADEHRERINQLWRDRYYKKKAEKKESPEE